MKYLTLILIILGVSILAHAGTDGVHYYLDSVSVGNPIEYRNLKIFPLNAKSTLSTRDYTTLDEAMNRGWLKIKESGEGRVNSVEVRNGGNEVVFMLTGEMVTGAKQDRMLEKDVLLPPYSDWISVPVYCVEHGRWHGKSMDFKPSGYVAPNEVRNQAKNYENQQEVWDSVAKSQRELGVPSQTGTVKDTYENKEVQKKIEDYKDNMSRIPGLSKSTIGVVVTTGSRIICMDMFANNSLLRKFWDKLIRSYAMDAISSSRSTLDRDDINEFLDIVESARFVSTETPGLGTLLSIESRVGKGSALEYENAVIHMDFFPRGEITLNHDPDLRLDFRRDQRNK
jgi:ARG and Rhodanese-Phosphatase-superfamily-associated Protein domain